MMRYCKKYLLLSFALFTCIVVYSQHSTLLFRNGKKVLISDFKADADYYEGKLTFTNLEGNSKTKYLENVFSVTSSNGNETIFYKPNEEFGETLSATQMKQYTLGMGDGTRYGYSPLVTMGGVVVGGLSGLLVNYSGAVMLGDDAVPVKALFGAVFVGGFAMSVLYPGLVQLAVPSAEELEKAIGDNDEYFLMGYQDKIKKKRLTNSILSTGVGFLCGAFVYSIAK